MPSRRPLSPALVSSLNLIPTLNTNEPRSGGKLPREQVFMLSLITNVHPDAKPLDVSGLGGLAAGPGQQQQQGRPGAGAMWVWGHCEQSRRSALAPTLRFCFLIDQQPGSRLSPPHSLGCLTDPPRPPPPTRPPPASACGGGGGHPGA
jgi:hypothetical protein